MQHCLKWCAVQNTSDVCWVKCVFEVVLGQGADQGIVAAETAGGLEASDLVEAWVSMSPPWSPDRTVSD